MTFRDQNKPAIRDPQHPGWALCPECRQSAQAIELGRLVCYRCGWVEPLPPARNKGVS